MAIIWQQQAYNTHNTILIWCKVSLQAFSKASGDAYTVTVLSV